MPRARPTASRLDGASNATDCTHLGLGHFLALIFQLLFLVLAHHGGHGLDVLVRLLQQEGEALILLLVDELAIAIHVVGLLCREQLICARSSHHQAAHAFALSLLGLLFLLALIILHKCGGGLGGAGILCAHVSVVLAGASQYSSLQSPTGLTGTDAHVRGWR